VVLDAVGVSRRDAEHAEENFGIKQSANSAMKKLIENGQVTMGNVQ
jgi:hypothetical protein